MSTQHKIVRTTSIDGRAVTSTQDVSGEVGQRFVFTIVDSAVDTLIAIAFAISKLKSIIITVDQNVTLETNDGTTPDDTINLKAVSAFQWGVGEERANPFTVDVDGFYFSNASGEDALVTIDVLYNEIEA